MSNNPPDPPLIPPSGNFESLAANNFTASNFFGSITGSIITNDITAENPSEPVNLFTNSSSVINIGSITINSSDIIGNVGNPILNQDVATKAYVDGTASSGDPNILIVKKNAIGLEYSSINAALASITTNSSTNPFIIQVNPGTAEIITVSQCFLEIVKSANP